MSDFSAGFDYGLVMGLCFALFMVGLYTASNRKRG